MKAFIGIDPGAKGGMACIREDGEVWCAPYDKIRYLAALAAVMHDVLCYGGSATCCLEKVHAMPRQGSVSMFTFGESYGWIKGVLDSFAIPFQEIPPQTWKKEFGLNSDKAKSIEVCRQLFPDVNLVPDGCRKPSDGMAEALLMAEYARRKL